MPNSCCVINCKPSWYGDYCYGYDHTFIFTEQMVDAICGPNESYMKKSQLDWTKVLNGGYRICRHHFKDDDIEKISPSTGEDLKYWRIKNTLRDDGSKRLPSLLLDGIPPTYSFVEIDVIEAELNTRSTQSKVKDQSDVSVESSSSEPHSRKRAASQDHDNLQFKRQLNEKLKRRALDCNIYRKMEEDIDSVLNRTIELTFTRDMIK